jgi:hypothetical protein
LLRKLATTIGCLFLGNIKILLIELVNYQACFFILNDEFFPHFVVEFLPFMPYQ